MTYERLCCLCEVRGWTICLSSKHAGNELNPLDPPAYLYAISVWFSRADWLKRDEKAPIVVTVGNQSLDEAAVVIETVLREGGVLS